MSDSNYSGPDADYLDCSHDEPQACPICGSDMTWESCWQCGGEGGFHDCGEDCCCCEDPENDLNEPCEECKGQGGYLQCASLPHSQEQMDANRQTDTKK